MYRNSGSAAVKVVQGSISPVGCCAQLKIEVALEIFLYLIDSSTINIPLLSSFLFTHVTRVYCVFVEVLHLHPSAVAEF